MIDDDDGPALHGTTDAIRPWTLKAMPNEVRNMAMAAARDEGLTVSQWVERLIRARVSGARAVATVPGPPAEPGAPPLNPADVAQLMQVERVAASMRDLASAGVHVAKRHAETVTRALLTQLPGFKPAQSHTNVNAGKSKEEARQLELIGPLDIEAG